ncbi:MAG TPA: biopolymer transporter ExbD [Tepidisphaeraceae bacterium]|jgi:biopolymer transport protein ExbD
MDTGKRNKKVHYDSGADMTSLVDVMFVLLIFLMMVGKFGGDTRYLVSDMPISTGGVGAPPPADYVPQEPITITVSAALDNYRAFIGNFSTGNDDELASALKSKLDQMQQAGRKVEEIQVFIKPSRNVLYGNIVRVQAAAIKAGFTKVGFQTSDG